jgi:NSS family neurotransmitter:Na+ symporter
LTQLWGLVAFLGLTAAVIAAGVQNGLERCNRILMPCLFVILIGLFINSFNYDGFYRACTFILGWDGDKLTNSSLLEAMGHAFFTLSLGLGIIVTYGSYLDNTESLFKMSLSVVVLDTLISILGGIVIFAVVFSFPTVKPEAGPTLVFQVLPILFSEMRGGAFLAVGFFLMLFFAALSSSVSILEVLVAFTEERLGISRMRATMLVLAGTAFPAFLQLRSFSPESGLTIMGLSVFDFSDKLTTNLMIPLSGMVISLFFGWKIGFEGVSAITSHKGLAFCLVWMYRLVTPAAILAVMINKFGLI